MAKNVALSKARNTLIGLCECCVSFGNKKIQKVSYFLSFLDLASKLRETSYRSGLLRFVRLSIMRRKIWA